MSETHILLTQQTDEWFDEVSQYESEQLQVKLFDSITCLKVQLLIGKTHALHCLRQASIEVVAWPGLGQECRWRVQHGTLKQQAFCKAWKLLRAWGCKSPHVASEKVWIVYIFACVVYAHTYAFRTRVGVTLVGRWLEEPDQASLKRLSAPAVKAHNAKHGAPSLLLCKCRFLQ